MSVEWCRERGNKERNSRHLSPSLFSSLSLFLPLCLTQVPVLGIKEQGLEAGHLGKEAKPGKGFFFLCFLLFNAL